MRRNFMILFIAIFGFLNLQTASAYTYYIDILDHWGEPYIEWATNEVSLFQGYNDGTFRPENDITRAEFISILKRLLEIQDFDLDNTDKNFQLGYTDLRKTFWAYNDIYEIAYYIENKTSNKVELKSIFPGNSFRANDPITRYEAGVLISLITPPPVQTINNGYKDLSSSLKFYKEIIKLTNSGIVKGYSDGTFRPWRNITRAEAATILKNTYMELQYLKTNQLYIRDLSDFNLTKKKPLFEYGTSVMNDDKLDKEFINAVTTLEYISFVGYIPHSEKHLYDPDPINSLWELKNNDYYNVIGLNYYLLYYDKSLVVERKVELIKEAFQHYETIGNAKHIEGIVDLVKLAKGIMKPTDLVPFLEQYFSKIKNNNEQILVGTILAEQYLNTDQYSKAFNVSKDLPNLTNDIEIKTHIMLNNGYLSYKNTGLTSAIDYLNKSWKDIKQDIRYIRLKEDIDFLFTSMMKQLMMK